MVTILNLGGQKKSWIKDLLIIGIAAVGGYYLFKAVTEGNGNGGAGGGGGIPTPQQQGIERTLGLLGQQLQKMGSGLETQNQYLNQLWDTATGIWKVNPFTQGTGIFYDWFTQWGNANLWDTGNGNGNGGTQPAAPTAPTAPITDAPPTFQRTAPAPVTQILSLPAKMHEIIPNLVVPVIPKSATPAFTQAIRALFPAQLL